MFSDMTNRQRFGTTREWLRRLITNLVGLARGSKRRFVILTPPFLAKQIIYDKNQEGFINIEIRNLVDWSILDQIFEYHDYDLDATGSGERLRQCYENIVKDGKVPLIIDCGGNSGMATRYFTETFKNAYVVYIEPDEQNVSMAKKNNTSNNVMFLPAGVGSIDTKANILDPGHGNWAYRVEKSDNGSIQLISIQTILGKFDLSKYVPFLIKIDIEGFERDLFERNTEWIDLFPALIIELHDWMLPRQANSNNFLREISKRNRDFVFHRENVFSISNTLL